MTSHKYETTLQPFTVFEDDGKLWFTFTTGELKGLVFRMEDEQPNDDTPPAFSVATNQYWIGGEETFKAKTDLIQTAISDFIMNITKEYIDKVEGDSDADI